MSQRLFAPSSQYRKKRDFQRIALHAIGCLPLVGFFGGCLSPQEKAQQHGAPLKTVCESFGREPAASTYSDAIYTTGSGASRIVLLDEDGKPIRELDPDSLINPDSIASDRELESYSELYRNICGGKPAFYDSIPYVVAKAETRQEALRKGREEAARMAEENRKREEELARRRDTERKERDAARQREEAEKQAANRQVLKETEETHRKTLAEAERNFVAFRNRIQSNYLFKNFEVIEAGCSEVREASSRPAYADRRRREISAIVASTFVSGGVIDLAGECAVRTTGSGGAFTSPCLGGPDRGPSIAYRLRSLFGNATDTSQAILEALERLPPESSFDVRVILKQSPQFHLECQRLSSSYRSYVPIDELAVTVVSFSNVQPAPRCISGSCANGHGYVVFPNGDSYTGNFQNSQPDGVGAYVAAKANLIYVANWRQGIREGFGLVKNLVSGTTSRVLHHGSVTIGMIEILPASCPELTASCDDKISAVIRVEPKGAAFDCQPHYSGPTERKDNDDRFPRGHGTLYLNCGRDHATFEGEFLNGVIDGPGSLRDGDGKIFFTGVWHAGVPDPASAETK